MAIITEDYVSFETAKLLKDKGFNEGCPTTYTPNGFFHTHNYRPLFGDIFAPTLQMAMKWLREVHNLSIEVQCLGKELWYVDVTDINTGKEITDLKAFPTLDSYEKAVEEAIHYCLEKLI